MDIRELIGVARRSWLLLAVMALLGALVAGGASILATPEYEARSQLFVAVRGGDSVTDLAQGNSFSERRVASYVTLATSSEVLADAAKRAGVDLTVNQLRTMITASSPSQTVLINIFATNTNAQAARKIADATAAALIDAVTRVEGGEKNSLVTLSIVEQATAPNAPVSPNKSRNIVLGLGIGLLAGVVIAVLRKMLDTKVRGREGLSEMTDLGVLGEIQAESEFDKNPLAILTDPHGLRAESFRQLRTQLQFTNLRHGNQTLLVTSSTPGEGKSSTSINLALIMAEAGSRVLLIDADLRRPRIADYLGLEGAVGLTTVLAGRVSANDAVQTVGTRAGLEVLTAGRIPPNPSELLGSASMQQLLRELSAVYDIIIIDAPPVLPVADPSVLAQIADGVMLVVSADGRVKRDQLSGTLEKLSAVQARVVGVTLNRVKLSGKAYSYRYEEKPEKSRKQRKARSGSESRRESWKSTSLRGRS
ncbi:polysaccharide biosynthesis tyrosine autokinase [Leucobacter iarius]|uniref:non-specific protein-tyrosine kinase n=1 Tax=Leucobacter iarius TaxID=333963 RepID=A0ABP4Y5W3_9MICO